MHILALLPGIIAFLLGLQRSATYAFLYVYLPTLLIFPDYYRWIAPGLPDPNFHQAVILVITFLYFKEGGTWRFSPMDLLIVAFAFCVGYSQYLATGYSDAQNLIFAMLCSVILPYAMAKALIEPKGIRVETAKIAVVVMAAVSIASLYEFRFVKNPFQLWLRPFFPGLGYGWVSNLRWGFGRVAGPYAHAILAGIVFAAGYRLQSWLRFNQAWGSKKKERWISRLLSLILAGGMFMTLSRGPWIGAFLAVGPSILGRIKKRVLVLVTMAVLSVAVGIPAYLGFKAYVSGGREGATSATQETAAYRKELFENYLNIALERSSWGWGQNGIPVIPGLPSVDNYWLLLALMHGLYALVLFAFIVFGSMIRLGLYGMRSPPFSANGSLAFDLAGICIMYVFSITTVFMGTQTQPLLFLVVGWAEGLLASKVRQETGDATETDAPKSLFQFKRVLH